MHKNKNNLKKLARDHTAEELANQPELSLCAGRREERRERGVDSQPSAKNNREERRTEGNQRRASGSGPHSASNPRRRQASRDNSEGRPGPSRRHDSRDTSEEKPGPSERQPSRKILKMPEPGQPGGLDDPLRNGLSGAKCKWYLRFLKEGKAPEEARKLALERPPGPSAVPRAEKRGSSQITPPQRAADAKRRKEDAPPTEGQPRSYAAAAAGTKVAILPESYPRETLSMDQQTALEQALIASMLKAGERYRGTLAFQNIRFRNGLVIVTCGDDGAVGWLQEQAPVLEQWAGPKLKTATGGEIPSGAVISIHFPRSAGVEGKDLLQLLQMQNKGLSTDHWRVLSRKDDSKSEGQLVRFGIDDLSAEDLRKRNSQVNFRFGTIQVYGLRKPMAGQGQEPSAPGEDEVEEQDVEGIDFNALSVAEGTEPAVDDALPQGEDGASAPTPPMED